MQRIKNQEKNKTRPIDKVIVKGKTTHVAIFEVLHGWHPMTLNPTAYNSYMAAWNLFLQKEFIQAAAIFEQVLAQLADDKATQRVLELCQKYIKNPALVDDNFDITKMTEK